MLMAVSSDGLVGDNGATRGTTVPAAYPANRWSVFDIDWNSDKPTWGAARPQNCSEMMAKQIADMAASVPPSERPSVPKRYMAYRNFVKALPLLTSVREIMDDPSYDVWFINFSSAVQANHSLSHVPVCEANMTLCAGKPGGSCSHAGGWSCPCAEEVLQPARCSHLYHDQSQLPSSGTPACGPTGRCDTGRVPQGNYLWDFRQANVTVKGMTFVDYFIEKYWTASATRLSPGSTSVRAARALGNILIDRYPAGDSGILNRRIAFACLPTCLSE